VIFLENSIQELTGLNVKEPSTTSVINPTVVHAGLMELPKPSTIVFALLLMVLSISFSPCLTQPAAAMLPSASHSVAMADK
jgi:hypothetical protein